MDAAHKLLKKTALFLVTALAIVAPLHAQSLVVSSTTVNLAGNQAQSISVTSSGTNISYTATGPTWVRLSSLNAFTTPDTLFFQIQSNCGTLPCTGQVTLHPATSSGDVIISVTYNNTGGGGTGTIVANPQTLVFNAFSGQSAAAQSVGLSTASTTAITYGITLDQTCGSLSSCSWLGASVSSGSFTISSTNPATLSVTANAFSLPNGQYTGHVVITPSVGTQTTITVTFNVGTGGGTGTLTVSQNSFQFAYPTGVQSQLVTVGSTIGGNSFNFTTSSQNSWLLFDFTTAGNSAGIGTHTISINASAAAQLASTTYQGTITLTNPFNTSDTTTITVSLTVNGGTGTISVSTNALTFTAVPGGAGQTQQVTLNAPSNAFVQATFTAFNSGGFFSVSSSSCFGTPNPGTPVTCSFTGSQTLNVTVNPGSLVNLGDYTGSLSFVSGTTTVSTSVHLILTNSITQLTVSPTSLSFNAVAGGASQASQIAVSVPTNAFVQGTISSFNGNFFSVSSPCLGTGTFSCQFNGSQTLTVTVNPASLTQAGTYTASLQFSSGGVTATVSVTLTLTSSGGGGSNGGIASPSSLSFAYQISSVNGPQAQLVVVAPVGAFSVTTPAVTTSQQWLSAVAQSTTAPSLVNVSVIPQGLPAGTYSGSFTINTTAGAQLVTVSLLVSGSVVIEAAPAVLYSTFQAGSAAPTPVVELIASDNSAIAATATSGTSWISIGTMSGSTPESFVVTLNASGLCNGLNTGSITVAAASAGNNGFTIPVVVVVSGSSVTTNCSSGGGSGPLTLGTSSMTFNAQVNGTIPAAQTLTVTATSQIQFNVSANTQAGQIGNWLSVTPCCFGLFTPQNLTVSVNQSGLPLGTYNGTISLTTQTSSGTQTQTVSITLNVTTTGGGSIINVSAATLNYSFQPGGSNPASQTLTVTGAAGTQFTYSASSTGSFLSASANGATLFNGQTLQVASTGSTPITVNVNPAGLTPGTTYTGTITLSPNGGSVVTVTVNLTIASASVVSASPTSLSFNYNAGDTTPSPQPVQVTGGSGLTFTATASSAGNWLAVSPTSGTTPASLSVSVSPAGLNANTYTGTITVTGTGTATGTTTINVTLTVTAPRPSITSVASAASYVGGSLSPGEIIAIFGTNLGPTPGVQLALDPATGKVATTLGGVQVLVNGFLAPMVYASATQVSAVIPYEVAGGPGTLAQVVVKFLGITSNGIATPVAATAPGLFTLNASGSGPGAILNANLSGNSPANPANKGDTIAIYLTGEGQTSPIGVTGKVTTISSSGPLTPVPLLPVAVLIDGQPAASISFAGEAPALVSGVMQLNVQIPPAARSGNLSLVVSIGGASSQPGVTVSVR